MKKVCGYLRYAFLNNELKPTLSSRFVINSTRSTYILKRRYEPFLSAENCEKFRLLKGKNYIYDLVEDTNQIEPPDLHVVLTTFVEGVGDIGDVISVMPQYARNHLLLPKRAVYATPENIEYFSKLKKDRPEEPKYSSILAGMTIRFLQNALIPVQMNSENPWTLEAGHIRVAFRKEGIIVPQGAIKLPETAISGPDPVKEGKDFAVFLTMNGKETFSVRCRLFHFKPGLENVKLPEECYLRKEDPILDEQDELLKSMPDPKVDDDPESYVSLKEKYRITLIN